MRPTRQALAAVMLSCVTVAAPALLTSMTAPAAHALTIDADGWVSAEHLDEAMEYAQENGRILLMLELEESYTCPRCTAVGNAWTNMPESRNAVRVAVYPDQRQAMREAITTNLVDYAFGQPTLHVVSPDGQLLASVGYRQEDIPTMIQTGRDKARIAGELMAWYTRAQRDLAEADQLAERGRYDRAWQTVQQIAERDAMVPGILAGDASSPDRQTADASFFFPDLIADRTETWGAQAQLVIDEAEELAADEQYEQAMRVIAPLTRAQIQEIPQFVEATERFAQYREAARAQQAAQRAAR